jgi:peptidoglycan/LPS O-acetylase OafA/YrhL
MKYIQQLDCIRAIAILLVIATHWFPDNSFINISTSILNGVDIFFVLSGFLISGILLHNRREAKKNNIPTSIVFKNFVCRRTLRIFPIYYLFILVLFLLGNTIAGAQIRENYLYFITYTSNFYYYNLGDWDNISHLWSLAVEEQFYLIWPWLLLLLPFRHLPVAIGLFIIAGVGSRLYLATTPFSPLLTFTCFDAFGLGAILAYAFLYKKDLLVKAYPLLSILALVALGLQIFRVYTQSSSLWLDLRGCTALFSVWLIATIILEKYKRNTPLTFVFNNRFLLFVGKISYGIYLYHHSLPKFTADMLSYINDRLPPFLMHYEFYLIRIENFVLLLALCWLSWVLIEKPFLHLKKYFEVRPKSIPRPQGVTVQPTAISV